MKKFLLVCLLLVFAVGCNQTQETKDAKAVNQQQSQYAKRQPVPTFDWSLERHLVTQLYQIRNGKVATHSVWRSNYGTIEGDCPSLGYGLPYDTSLTNPLKTISMFKNSSVVEQAEPNGVFASKNTSATWIMCIGVAGTVEPMYVESKVTVYPGPVKVNYQMNRVHRVGASNVKLKMTGVPTHHIKKVNKTVTQK